MTQRTGAPLDWKVHPLIQRAGAATVRGGNFTTLSGLTSHDFTSNSFRSKTLTSNYLTNWDFTSKVFTKWSPHLPLTEKGKKMQEGRIFVQKEMYKFMPLLTIFKHIMQEG